MTKRGTALGLLLTPVVLLSIGADVPHDIAEQRLEEAIGRLDSAPSDRHRFYALTAAAKRSFEAGDPDRAEVYATALLDMAPGYRDDWNYGNAMHDGHMVLGRVALARGDVAEAGRRLLEAGRTPGSPQLGSFGPNVALARDLLEAGEREVVLQYFELCSKFWKDGREDELPSWTALVQRRLQPDFGPNLIF